MPLFRLFYLSPQPSPQLELTHPALHLVWSVSVVAMDYELVLWLLNDTTYRSIYEFHEWGVNSSRIFPETADKIQFVNFLKLKAALDLSWPLWRHRSSHASLFPPSNHSILVSPAIAFRILHWLLFLLFSCDGHLNTFHPDSLLSSEECKWFLEAAVAHKIWRVGQFGSRG